eukprot:713489-Prymnesium_polylepis.1
MSSTVGSRGAHCQALTAVSRFCCQGSPCVKPGFKVRYTLSTEVCTRQPLRKQLIAKAYGKGNDTQHTTTEAHGRWRRPCPQGA